MRILRFVVSFVFAMTAVGWTAAIAAETGSLKGVVTDASHAPLAAVTVDLRGPGTYTTETDATGAFSITSVVPGLYSVTLHKAGFQTSTGDVAIIAGEGQNLTVQLSAASFSSLQTIATVHARSGSTFNTSPASVSIVSAKAFQDQAQSQTRDVLNQIPGIQISLPGSTANGAAPSSVVVPTIRGSASYETATLIDGHPLAVESYGDYVTTSLSSYMFSNIEIIKGPGATAPEVNNAINGTVNFRTKDPTETPTPDFAIGFTNFGGTWANFGFSDTVGRLGFVVAIANLNDPSSLNGKRVLIDPSSYHLGSTTQSDSLLGNATYTQVPNTQDSIQTGYSLLACCYTLQGYLNTTSELVKFRYRLSPATIATVSYLGSQESDSSSESTGSMTNATFNPGPGYTGSLAPGPHQVVFLYPGSYDTSNQPIFQAEISSSIGNDTILARYYHATINSVGTQGAAPDALAGFTDNLFGTSSNQINTSPYGSYPATYNGTSTPIYDQNYFREIGNDKLSGWSVQYDHPFAQVDDVSFALNQTKTDGLSYELFPTFSSVSIPQGSSQLFTTAQLRVGLYLTPKLKVTLADYINSYRSTYAVSCPFAYGYSNCNFDGSNVTFATTTTRHNDPRLALEFRPKPNLSVRFAAGSAIAPPYLALLSQISAPTATYDPLSGIATITKNSGQLKPETAFGYDLGADWRLRDQQTIVSGDVYLNNLFNHYFGQSVNSGTVCGAPIPCSPAGAPANTPVYDQTNTNISNFRFEGAELSISRHPTEGLGYTLAGGVQRGYVYNLPLGFYCSQPVPSCINNPSNWDQNLSIIAGQNLNGEGVAESSTVGSLNTREPYSQGYGEISYALHGGGYASFGETYYGNNNSFNQRPFLIANATVRMPINDSVAIQVSGRNLFNTLPGYFPTYGGGLPIPLANASGCTASSSYGCGSGATTGNVYGPAVFSVVLMKRLP